MDGSDPPPPRRTRHQDDQRGKNDRKNAVRSSPKETTMNKAILALALVMMAGAAHAQAPVADYFSLDSSIDGNPLVPGTLIEAYDGNGILCGSAQVNLDGGFLVHVNGDDPLTPGVDEGATNGEFLTWRIAATEVAPADATWIANLVGAFNDLRWENGAAKQMRLDASTSAVEAESWTAVKDLYRP
jgi:hypothetical protein